MAELLISNVEESLLQRLQERAAAHGSTAEVEAKEILAEALVARNESTWAEVDAIYNRHASSGRTFSDSAELLREDRER